MPYIPQARRELLQGGVAPLDAGVGDLTFALTDIVLAYIGEDPRFDDFAAAVAALECTKLELYRRSVAPYETGKARQNGDLPYPHAREIR